MGNLIRLPREDKQRVMEIKSSIKGLLETINKSGAGVQDKLNMIKGIPNIEVSNIYEHDIVKELYVIDFDYSIVCARMQLNISTGLVKLEPQCTVFLENSEIYVDNYYW